MVTVPSVSCHPGLHCLVAVALMAASWDPAEAQVYHFDNAPVPASYSLTTHYMFYIYSTEDAPSQKSGVGPAVEFRQIRSERSTLKEPPGGYKSVEVSLLPYDMFWDLVNPERFCANEEDVRNRQAEETCRLVLRPPKGQQLADVNAYSHVAPFRGKDDAVEVQTYHHQVKNTGRYILAFTNCGNFSHATLSGSIAVINPYGYLPAHEFYNMRLFGWMTLVYLALLLVWSLALVRFMQGLSYLQQGLGGVILLCVCECFFSWVCYKDWNDTGDRRDSLFTLSLTFYILKYILAWRLVHLMSMGAGLLHEEDYDSQTTAIFFLASVAFMVSSCAWKMIIGYRHSFLLSSNFLLLVTVPGVLVHLGLFIWTFYGLSGLLERLEEQKQAELLLLHRKTGVVLAAGLTSSALVLLLQVVDIASGGNDIYRSGTFGGILSWEYQWLPADGAPHFAFLAVLLGMMAVWWPQEEWKWSYAPPDGEDEEKEGLASGQVVNGNGDYHHSKSSGKPSKKSHSVTPEPIGIAEEEDEEDTAALL